jgi:hypothetical protein
MMPENERRDQETVSMDNVNGIVNDSRKLYAKHFLIAAPQTTFPQQELEGLQKFC